MPTTGTGPISGPISDAIISPLCFVLIPALVYLATFIPLYGLSLPDILRGAAPDLRRQHHDRDRRPHLYEFVAVLAVPGAAGLVSVRQDRRRPDRGRGLPRQSADPVAGADRARDLPARLDRDAAGGCVSDPGVLFRAVSRLGAAAANARLHLLLSAVRDHRELALVYALRAATRPRWLLWAFVAVAFAGFAAMLPISAAFVGTSMATFNRLMIFQNWI